MLNSNKHWTKEWFEKYSMMLDEENFAILLGYLKPLETLHFSLCVRKHNILPVLSTLKVTVPCRTWLVLAALIHLGNPASRWCRTIANSTST